MRYEVLVNSRNGAGNPFVDRQWVHDVASVEVSERFVTLFDPFRNVLAIYSYENLISIQKS